MRSQRLRYLGIEMINMNCAFALMCLGSEPKSTFTSDVREEHVGIPESLAISANRRPPPTTVTALRGSLLATLSFPSHKHKQLPPNSADTVASNSRIVLHNR